MLRGRPSVKYSRRGEVGMGQKNSKVVVAENCLKPHHAHKCSDVDLKKLRAFIKTGKLAPCFEPYEGEDWRSREVRTLSE